MKRFPLAYCLVGLSLGLLACEDPPHPVGDGGPAREEDDGVADVLTDLPPPKRPDVALHHDGPGRPACQIDVSGHQSGGWSTDWHPRKPGEPHPTHARSTYWASDSDLEVIKNRNIDYPLEFTCAGPAKGWPSGAVSVSSRATREDVPQAAKTYPIVGAPPEQANPDEFVVGILLVGEHRYQPTHGKLELKRFDERGVAGSFELTGKLGADSKEEIKVSGRFDIPCGDVMQSLCRGGGASGVAKSQ